MSQDHSIIIQGLTKSFGKLKVLTGIDFVIERGTVLALLGPNGAGKTTTIRILSTLLSPDSGQVLINGFDVTKQAHKVRESIGLTGQYAAVDEYLTGKENLEMIGQLYHLSTKDVKQRSTELLADFDLVEAANRTTKTYSGGMRRRLDLAASLIATPPVLFLDEPTTGLDPRSRQTLWEIIKKLVDADVTILLTTQHMEEADKLADRIAVLDGGKIIANGTANELKQQVGKERLEFIFTKKGGFEKAVEIVKEEAMQQDRKRMAISFATDGTAGEIKRVLNQLEQSSIEIETLSLHKPTLDDVFIQLTGHEAVEKNEGKEAK